MNYKQAESKIDVFKSADLYKFTRSKRHNYDVLLFFFSIDEVHENLKTIVESTYASRVHVFKGQDVFGWFEKTLKLICKGWRPDEALAQNRKLPGYSDSKTSHRDLFYDMCNDLKQVIIRLCECNCDSDLKKLDYIQPMRKEKAGKKRIGFISRPLDMLLINIYVLMNFYTENSMSMLINMLNRGNLNEYLHAMIGTFDVPVMNAKLLNVYAEYMSCKDDEYLRTLKRYRYKLILKNYLIIKAMQKLGLKPKPHFEIREVGIMQLDVKMTHYNDLKYLQGKRYWIAIIDVETGLCIRAYYERKPTKEDTRRFVQMAQAMFIERWGILFLSIRTDNAPEYSSNPQTNVFARWMKDNGIKQYHIPKGCKEANGDVENSNKHMDFEFLPLIHTAKSDEFIEKQTERYNNLHNYQIPREFKRIINGNLTTIVATPIEWLHMIRQNNAGDTWTDILNGKTVH